MSGYTFDYMTVTEPRPAQPDRPPVRRAADRSNGQWKVDGPEPLNGNETWKQEDNGLNVRERIEQVYSREGFDSIPHPGPVGPFPLVGALHAAPARHRRRPHRAARATTS